MIVKDTLTPLSRDEASRAFLLAYLQLTGKLPTPAVLALLLAQSAFETGHWKSLHNFNFGNAKAGPGYPLVTQFHCSEVDERGVETFYDPPDPHCNFRAYNDSAAGALDYLKVLQHQPHWWQGLHTEDPSAFVDALATPPKYFTGNPAIYKRSVASLFQTFLPLAEVGLAVASVRPPVPAAPSVPQAAPAVPLPPPVSPPAPARSSSSDSPPPDSSGVRPVPSSNGNSAKPIAKRSFWDQLLGFVVRIVRRLLLRGAPPGGEA